MVKSSLASPIFKNSKIRKKIIVACSLILFECLIVYHKIDIEAKDN